MQVETIQSVSGFSLASDTAEPKQVTLTSEFVARARSSEVVPGSITVELPAEQAHAIAEVGSAPENESAVLTVSDADGNVVERIKLSGVSANGTSNEDDGLESVTLTFDNVSVEG
ncbi:hypothetical protein OV450_5280 [Actinobacteria bacterium OV450]|nr:hypothetical protein OV450_5280 [Actinobacteria bacterium OV450]